MRIVRLAPGDEALLDAAVRQFRHVDGVEHGVFLRDPATLVMLAVRDTDVVGWAWGLRQRHVCGYSQLQLYEIEVVEAARRQGVGRALVAAFLDVARAEGHAKMWLLTSRDNAAAQELYRTMGGGPSPHDDAGFWWRLNP